MGESSTIRRRQLLRGIAVGGAAIAGLSGTATARTGRHNVGADSASAVREARARADHVHRVIDLAEYGTIVSGAFAQGDRAALRNRDDVSYVTPDRPLELHHHRDDHAGGPPGDDDGDEETAQALPWGIDRTDAEVAHATGDTAAGAHLAIIDTGIDPTHEDLSATVGDGKAFAPCRPGWCDEPWDDDHDHGTHVAGTANALDNDRGVVGVGTEATLHALKVCDKSGFCATSDIADAIRYTADKHVAGDWNPAVANLSLGSSSESPELKDAGGYATDRGVLLVSSAGNAGPDADSVGYPAKYEEYMAISASTIEDAIASFSSRGAEVELIAPGEDVCSTIPDDDYDSFSGTSMAAPHVTGAGGHLVAAGQSNDQARATLQDSAEDLGLASTEQGAGLLDVAAALGHDSSDDGIGDGAGCP